MGWWQMITVSSLSNAKKKKGGGGPPPPTPTPDFVNLTMDDRHIVEDAVQGDLVGNLLVDTNIPTTITYSILESPTKWQLNGLRVERGSFGTITAGVNELLTVRGSWTGGSADFPFNLFIDVDNPPIGINLDSLDIEEDDPAGTVVGNLTAIGGQGALTWTLSGNAKFTTTGAAITRTASGTVVAGVPEPVTVMVTDANSETFSQNFSLVVTPVPAGGVTQSWLNPPALPTRKIKVHWVGAGDITLWDIPVANIVVETTNCWQVENVVGMGAWDGQLFSSLDALYSAIAPTLDLAGVTAEVDAGYVAQGSNGLSMDVSGVSWAWTCATEWSHTPPYLGGFHYRTLIGHSIHQVGLNDASFLATQQFKNWFFGILPCETAKETSGVAGSGAVVGGTTLAVSSIGIDPDYVDQYAKEAYRIEFDQATATVGLRGKQFTIVANSTGANPTLTISGGWVSGAVPVAGDTFKVFSAKQAGDDIFYVVRVGLLVRDHVGVGRGGSNGLAVQGTYEWELRTQGQIHDFDCLTFGCGGVPTQHNHYVHNVRLYASLRCYSHSSCGASWKAECDSFILDDFTSAGHMFTSPSGWGNNNTLCDAQQHVRCYYRNGRLIPTNFDNTWKKRNWLTIQMRLSNLSSHSRLLPTPFAKNLGADPVQVIFKYGAVGVSTTVTGRVVTGTSGTTLKMDKLAGLLVPGTSGSGNRTLSNLGVNAYDVQFYYDDGTIYTGQLTIVSVSSGVYTCTASPALTKAASQGRALIVKLVGDNWDFPLVDSTAEDWCNSASPTYLWDMIVGADGELDLTKQNGATWGFPGQYVDGCFMTPTHQSLAQCGLFQDTKDCYNGSFNENTGAVVEVPLPPVKSNNGAWANPSGAGEWTGQLRPTAPGLGTNGTGGTGYLGSDFVRPNFFAVRCMNWWTKGMTALSYHVDLSPGSASQPLALPSIPQRGIAVTATGVKEATPLITQNLFDSPVMLQTTGSCAAGGSSVTVDSLNGLSVGMFLSIACDNQWGSDLGTHSAAITALVPTSKQIIFAPALPTGPRGGKAIQIGYKISALPYVSWPSWALNPELSTF